MSVNMKSSIELQKEHISTISSSEKEEIPTKKAPFTITIHMEKQFYLTNPTLHIVIVDTITQQRMQYEIKKGDTVQIPAYPGVHNIRFTSSLRSNSLTVNVQENVYVEVGFNRMTGHLDAKQVSERNLIDTHNASYNILTILGLLCALLSIILVRFTSNSIILSVIAIIFSIIGMCLSKNSGENKKARDLGISSMFIGFLTIILSVFFR